MLTPIESHLRSDDDPSDWMVVVRGRPLTIEAMSIAAGRTLAEFSWYGGPSVAVSAEVTGPGRSAANVLAGPRLWTRRTYAAAAVTALIDGGFPVLGTFGAPHVSIVLPEYSEAGVRGLIDILGPEQPNPYYMRILP